MKKLKIGIVGCGRISECYRDVFHKLSDKITVEYAVDKDIEKAKKFAADFSSRYTATFEDILDEDLDVIHLCLPHFLHKPYSVAAMKHGKNVLTEKPLAMSLDEADEMIKTEKRTGKILGCIFKPDLINRFLL